MKGNSDFVAYWLFINEAPGNTASPNETHTHTGYVCGEIKGGKKGFVIVSDNWTKQPADTEM